MTIQLRLFLGVLLWGTPLHFAQIKSDLSTTLSSPNSISVRIINKWPAPVEALIVDGSIDGLPHIRGFYDSLYNFKHDYVVPPARQVVISIPIPHGIVANTAKFRVTCVAFQGGGSIGDPSCVDRIRRRRKDLFSSLTRLREILQKNKTNEHRTSEVIQDINNLRLARDQSDPDVSNANDMAAAFGVANIQTWAKSLGDDDPQANISKLLVICDEWRNNLTGYAAGK